MRAERLFLKIIFHTIQREKQQLARRIPDIGIIYDSMESVNQFQSRSTKPWSP